MERFNWQDKLEPVMFWIRLTGLWPKDGSYKLNIYTLYAITIHFVLMFANTFFQTIKFFIVKLDFEDVASGLLLVLGHILGCTKILGFTYSLKSMKSIYATLNNKMFQPKTLKQLDRMERDLKLWLLLARTYQIGINSVFVVCILLPFVTGSYKNYELPYFAWYPVNVKTFPWYQILYGYQTMGLFFTAATECNLDMFLVGLAVYIGAQCDILCDDLKEIRNDSDLICCFLHHKEIINIAAEFNEMYGKIIVVQFLASAISLAVCLFNLSIAVQGTIQFYMLATLWPIIILEIFVFCWYGNEVKVRSDSIPNAAFECEWFKLSTSTQKSLLFFIMRTQNPISITAYNVLELSLKTFVAIMRSSWSYYVVLSQVKNF